MRTNFAKARKGKSISKPERITTQEHLGAIQTIKLILAKKDCAELSRKEQIGCSLATD